MIGPHVLYETALSILFAIGFLIVVVFLILEVRARYKARKKQIRDHVSRCLSEVILSDSPEDVALIVTRTARLLKNLQKRRADRRIMMEEIMRLRLQFSGVAADNLRLFYEHLALDAYSFRRLSSRAWFVRARAVQELGVMGQRKYLRQIYRRVNDRSSYVRMEAQVALVRLAGARGFRFFNMAGHPLTEWQQLCLLQLPAARQADSHQIRQWLNSANRDAVLFALRLMELQKKSDLLPELNPLLHHLDEGIRRAATGISRSFQLLAADETCLSEN